MAGTEEVRKRHNPHILVAPLDWGLGHATRCIPIIQELIRQGCEVSLAGEGAQEILLKKEFPLLPFLPLAGYRVRYSGNGRNMVWKMIGQAIRLREAIQYENEWLKDKITEAGFDAVISDNRYGLYNKKIPSVFITHQLTFKSPWRWTEGILQKQNYRYINRFTECWVPDEEGPCNLAGVLSHPVKKPASPLYYIGHLSRFKMKGIGEIKNHLLILLSGPEPQRSIFENKIIKQISLYPATAVVLRGLPEATSVIPSTNSIHIYNHLSGEELNTEMGKAAFVIARSGYSTLMDAMALKKKCILVPTPGQTEQEYLAAYHTGKQQAIHSTQKKFSLTEILKKAESSSFLFPDLETDNLLEKNISRFLSSL